VNVVLGNGNGTFQKQVSYVLGTGPYAVAVGDFTGDGIPDIVTINNDATMSLLIGNGDGTFRSPTTVAVGVHGQTVTAADLIGNGILDFLVPDNTTNAVKVLLGNGDGTFQAPLAFPTSANPYAVAVGDTNDDGLPDLVTADPNSNNFNVLFNDGNWPTLPAGDAASPNRQRSQNVPVPVGPWNGESMPSVVSTSSTVSETRITRSVEPDTVPEGATSGPVPDRRLAFSLAKPDAPTWEDPWPQA
jgi:hypothetical protein